MDNGFNRFSENAKKSLIAAQDYAAASGIRVIDSSYVLLGFLSAKGSVACEVLEEFGLTSETVKELIVPGSKIITPAEVATGLSYDVQKSLEIAFNMASKMGDSFVASEHILMAILSQDNSEGSLLVKRIGLRPEDITKRLEEILKEESGEYDEDLSQMMGFSSEKNQSNKKESILEEYSTNLTNKAKNNELDPVVGRDKEISRLISIINRRTKNNPVLIGEPGVGKTAIVEGLALAIANETVPEMLMGKEVLVLDLASVVAGTKYRGEFEDRLVKIVKEVKKNKKIILFIDEIHNLVGAGAAEGAIDAANILKPALSRGEMQIIGATTLNEYRKYIEKDAALERRFQPIVVPETNIDETIAILQGLRPRYEEYHNVQITDEAIVAATKLAKRYISDRFLPDKAIDLIDEAAALKKVKKGAVSKLIKNLNKEIKEIRGKKEDAVLAEDFAYAAELKQKEEILAAKLKNQKVREGLSDDERPLITEENIAEVISISTGVPITRLVQKESESLLKLESALKKNVIGQDEAVETIASAIRRARTGVSDTRRPIGSFMFLGPTGVGKTELAKVIAKEIFGDSDALVKIDMSEFMEKHNVSRLVGAPAGYVGFEEGGQLTEIVRRRPYSVILLDEIEKAHGDVFNILLQILEDGYLTDAKGVKVDFRNTIIIMTSNVGAKWLGRESKLGFAVQSADDKDVLLEIHNRNKDLILEDLKKRFKPEFLNRLDHVVVFKALTKSEIKKIINLQLSELATRLKEKNISIKVSDSAKNFLIEKGYDAENGARPLRRAIQSRIEDPLASGILRGEFREGDLISIYKEGEELKLYVLETSQK